MTSTDTYDRTYGRARFEADTTQHQMTILRDDGLYRHLRFKAPDGGLYWFDLITWPGRLAVTGDVDTFVFARTDDMFDFFRGSSKYGPNPGYWAEKIQDGRERAKRYDEDKFRQLVTDAVKECEADWPGLTAATSQELGEYDVLFEAGANEFLRDFTYRTAAGKEAIADAEATHRRGVLGWRELAKTMDRHTFRLNDAWEWDLNDWTWEYLWCCHGIVWGIGCYDEAKAATPVAAVAS